MIPIDEAEKLEGFPVRATLRRWAEAGLIIGERIQKGSRLTWRVCPDSIRRKLAGEDPGDYPRLYDRWLAEMASGYHTGKAIGETGLHSYKYGLWAFWVWLENIPKEDRPDGWKVKEGPLSAVTVENLRIALSNVTVDYKNNNCRFSQREWMYKAFGSFLTLLIRNGLRPAGELEAVRKLKPKRIFPPRKTVLKADSLKHLIDYNDSYKMSRGDFDCCLTRTIIMLGSVAGLRRAEMLNLQVGHIFLKNRELLVYNGKGHKSRRVGLTPGMMDQIREWLKFRPDSDHPQLLLSKNGKPLDKGGLYLRLKRMAIKTGVDVTPHGLRRSFATINSEKGAPLPILQRLLGHAKIETTMDYIMIDEQAAVDFLKGHKSKGSKPDA